MIFRVRLDGSNAENAGYAFPGDSSNQPRPSQLWDQRLRPISDGLVISRTADRAGSHSRIWLGRRKKNLLINDLKLKQLNQAPCELVLGGREAVLTRSIVDWIRLEGFPLFA